MRRRNERIEYMKDLLYEADQEIAELRANQRIVIDNHTLEQVVARYLDEMDNPAPDFSMRQIYRRWMRAFVEHEEMHHG